jgi:hypothetical protein
MARALVFPYRAYNPAVRSVERLLYLLEVIVRSFEWMVFDTARYAGGNGLARAAL